MRLFFVPALFILFLPAAALTQGWYWGSPVTPSYDRASVIEISGVVLQADLSQRGGPPSLRLESGGETFTVVLGPGWYLRQQRADIRIGDRLAVRGSKMKGREGKTYLVAAWVKNVRTGQILELRDDNGRPFWSSRGRTRDKIPEKKP
ncbi:MAG: DNA-binding protein [Syntrophales bacterium]